MRVKDKVVIVTGAGSGIGAGIAQRLAAEGARVVVNDIDPALGEQTVAAIQGQGGVASFMRADVTRSADMQALVAAAVQRHGRLDAMVNNAGWTHRNRPALEVSEEEFDRCFAVNVKSLYLATVHATPVFRAQGGGSFVTIASIAGSRRHRGSLGLPSGAGASREPGAPWAGWERDWSAARSASRSARRRLAWLRWSLRYRMVNTSGRIALLHATS